MNIKSEDLYELKHAIRLLTITNLINAGVITKEEALNYHIYREFLANIKNSKVSKEPIQATVDRKEKTR